jgi:hypothetical protein
LRHGFGGGCTIVVSFRRAEIRSSLQGRMARQQGCKSGGGENWKSLRGWMSERVGADCKVADRRGCSEGVGAYAPNAGPISTNPQGRGTIGRQWVLNRSGGKSPLSGRHRCMGEYEIPDLSLQRS